MITGASKGIGRETAQAYGCAGCAGIAIAARSREELDSLIPMIKLAASSAGKAEPKVYAVTLDVTEEKSVSAAAEFISQVFPRVDILINNAGYLEKRTRIIDSDPEEWWKTWTVNVKGPYLVTRAFLPVILERGGDKTIVNISSAAANRVISGASSYAMTKLALQRFTQFLDVDHTSDGILTYCVHPGNVLTDMGKRQPQAMQDTMNDSPGLCGDTLVFLTEKRQEWLAGRYVSVNWDMEEFFSMKDEIVQGNKLKTQLVV